MLIGIYNSDPRFKVVANCFKDDNVIFIANKQEYQKIASYLDVLILGIHGLVGSELFIEDIYELKKDCIIFSGIKQFELYASDYMTYYYLQDKNVQAQNAIYTAEGVLLEIIKNTSTSIFEQKIDVVGFGYCGKAIMQILQMLSIETRMISQHCEDETICCPLKKWDYPAKMIINTAKHCYIDEEYLARMVKETIILDIVMDNGIDCALADKYKVKVIKLESLPSKYCIESSGMLIYEYIRGKIDAR